MSLVQSVSPCGALFVDDRQHLARNRPTLLLACLGMLCRYTDLPWLTIGSALRVNFPELLAGYGDASLLVHLRSLWDEVRAVRPEWLNGMQRGQGEDTAISVLNLLRHKAFCCSCLFPAGWRNWQEGEVDVFWYLNQLVNAQSRAEAEAGV